MVATSTECFSTFWPYEVRNFSVPSKRMSSGCNSCHAEVGGRLAALLADLLLNLGADAFDDLLDARRMNAAVGDELLEGQPGDLPAQRIEGGNEHRLGGVVDDQVDAADHFEGADVAPFATDDAPLHVVGRQFDERYGVLGDVVARRPLDRHRDDLLRLAARRRLGVLFDAPHDVGGLFPRFAPQHLYQRSLGLLGGLSGDALEARERFGVLAVGFALGGFGALGFAPQFAFQPRQFLFAILESAGAPFELFFPARDAPLELAELAAAVAALVFEFLARPQVLLARRDPGFLGERRGALLGPAGELFGLGLRLVDQPPGKAAPGGEPQQQQDGARGADADGDLGGDGVQAKDLRREREGVSGAGAGHRHPQSASLHEEREGATKTAAEPYADGDEQRRTARKKGEPAASLAGPHFRESVVDHRVHASFVCALLVAQSNLPTERYGVR